MHQRDRAIDWRRDDTSIVLRRIRAADGAPGVLDEVAGLPCYLFDAHREGLLRGEPGAIVATRAGAICRATRDGAVWIGHLRRADDPTAFKLPATRVLDGRQGDVQESSLAPERTVDYPTWQPIRYVEAGKVGFLHFAFYNGAMGIEQCAALRSAYAYARSRPTRVIALMGGEDFWSNGIHLNLIEASPHPADESWRSINAIDDLVHDIVVTGHQLTIAAMAGNAGAGGVFMALAADRVYARDGVILNPHYKGMGNLYGSEYWTYLLPRRVAPDEAQALIANRLPIGVDRAAKVGLIDGHFGASAAEFCAGIGLRAAALAADPEFARLLAAKHRQRADDEATKPLAAYREAELLRMRLSFYGFDSSYHVARFNFVRKVPRSRTPHYLAPHRTRAVGRAAALVSATAHT
jgi:putative two-component system hydrogenase maturation factor HypX/HoxX